MNMFIIVLLLGSTISILKAIENGKTIRPGPELGAEGPNIDSGGFCQAMYGVGSECKENGFCHKEGLYSTAFVSCDSIFLAAAQSAYKEFVDAIKKQEIVTDIISDDRVPKEWPNDIVAALEQLAGDRTDLRREIVKISDKKFKLDNEALLRLVNLNRVFPDMKYSLGVDFELQEEKEIEAVWEGAIPDFLRLYKCGKDLQGLDKRGSSTAYISSSYELSEGCSNRNRRKPTTTSLFKAL